MKKLSPADCIEICKLIKPSLTWIWNDHFNLDNPPFYAINGTGNSDELYMVKIYYTNGSIVLMDGNSINMDETIIDYKSNKLIQDIIGVELDENIFNEADKVRKLIVERYVEKITDKFSNKDEYRLKESAILDNNEGLPYSYKFDLSVRVFVENNDFLDSKIILVLTFYAPEPGTGTILHESVADVVIDHKVFFKLDNEYFYNGLDYYGASGYKLEICNEKLAENSSRIEQIQFNIDLVTLMKIVNAEILEIRFNKKYEYSGSLTKSEIMNFVGLYNALFDNKFRFSELIDFINSEVVDWEKIDGEIKSLCEIGKTTEAIELLQAKAKYDREMSHLLSFEEARKYVLEFQEFQDSIQNNQTNNQGRIKSDSKCFIITATMNNPSHPIVDEFRAFRDTKLLTNVFGRAFVCFYYKVGPLAALVISQSVILRTLSFLFFVNPVYKMIKNDLRKNKFKHLREISNSIQ